MTPPNNHVVQIYLNDKDPNPPALLEPAITSVRRCFSNYRYTLHGLESLRQFIADQFDRDVLHAYDRLAPYSYKADLGRYCLVYKLGGWYADSTIMMRKPVAGLAEGVEMLYFFDVGDGLTPGRSLFDVSTSLFYARAGCPMLATAIERIVANCAREYYGESIYCPTGPTVFGASIASHGRRKGHVVGHLMPLTPLHRQRNHSFVLPSGEILALFKKAWLPPGTRLFGGEGTNNYVEMWHARQVYRAQPLQEPQD